MGQPLRLVIDVHMIGERETGNETYTLNLVRSLLHQFPNHCYTLLTAHREVLAYHLPTQGEAFLVDVPANPLRRLLLTIPHIIRRTRAHLLHVNYIAPPHVKCPIVVTVHDIAYALYPHFFSLRDRLLLSVLVPLTLSRAVRVIAVSQRTRDDLVAYYHIPLSKIVVTYEGTDSRFRPLDKAEARARMAEKYGLTRPYILTLGNLQPRKNIPRLIRAYARLQREGKIDLPLVIVGQARWRETEIYRAAQEAREGTVLFTGYVPDDDLPLLYNAAQFFVYPSLYEGFGLPPLEAMACGTAVLCSSAGALPEVVGDAALLVDPYSESEIAAGLEQMANSPDLRATLAERGFVQAQRFSWDIMARQTELVYREVVEEMNG